MEQIRTFKNYLGELTVTYRRTQKPGFKINSSRDLAEFVRPYFEMAMDDHEEFKVIHLNNANHVLNLQHLSTGGLTATLADIRLVMREALIMSSVAICLVHNHPSGQLRFSKGDRDVTAKIKNACQYFDIAVLDHIVITREDYVSMADEGLL